jgi:hypothetical protein
MIHLLHAAELAAWIAGAGASVMAGLTRADTKRSLLWLAVAGALCNLALVISHAG